MVTIWDHNSRREEAKSYGYKLGIPSLGQWLHTMLASQPCISPFATGEQPSVRSHQHRSRSLSPKSMLLEAHPSRCLILSGATCRSISAKLISIRAMNLCQKPTGTKLILNTRWMVFAIGCRMLWVSSPGLDGRRCGKR